MVSVDLFISIIIKILNSAEEQPCYRWCELLNSSIRERSDGNHKGISITFEIILKKGKNETEIMNHFSGLEFRARLINTFGS